MVNAEPVAHQRPGHPPLRHPLAGLLEDGAIWETECGAIGKLRTVVTRHGPEQDSRRATWVR
jgi:hypothetical protein